MASLPLMADLAPIAPGAAEELAGPPHRATVPVAQTERIGSLDVLRGFSLMGILIMNITDFSMPGWNYLFPLSTVKPVFDGPHWKVNTAVWFLRWILAEGKMRALFSMLFGAGVILLTSRAEARGAGVRAADIYTRRNMWLVLFGIVHCYCIWDGDILFYYGMTALLFLFPCRNLKSKTLLWMAVVVLLCDSLGVATFYDRKLAAHRRDAAAAHVVESAHRPLSDEQKKAIADAHHDEDSWRPSTKKLYEEIAKHQHGYVDSRLADRERSYASETSGFLGGLPDILCMMLFGMGLYRNGFLTGKLSSRTYAWTAAIGLGVAWPVIGLSCWLSWRGHFDLIQTGRLTWFPYELGRIGGALGNAAILLLLVKHGVARWLLARIAAVGQMALSNYLLTSILMQTVFVWSPLHWYGYLEYYKVYFVVLAMWTVNLLWSKPWLERFQFGPAEWMWRSLTYWKRQPMRLEGR